MLKAKAIIAILKGAKNRIIPQLRQLVAEFLTDIERYKGDKL